MVIASPWCVVEIVEDKKRGSHLLAPAVPPPHRRRGMPSRVTCRARLGPAGGGSLWLRRHPEALEDGCVRRALAPTGLDLIEREAMVAPTVALPRAARTVRGPSSATPPRNAIVMKGGARK